MERMEAVWGKVREKQSLEKAARLLREKRSRHLGWKLSLSAACGLLVALLPAAGAARAMAGFLLL